MKDRRRSPRMNVVLKVRFQTKADFQDAFTHSLSQLGVYLATDTPFDVGSQFLIEISLPGKKGTVTGKCEVVWVNEIETKEYPRGMGVKFIEMETRDSEILEKYLLELGNA